MGAKARAGLLIVAAAAVVLAGGRVGARPEHQTQFRRIYQPPRRSELVKASCMLCHLKRRGGTKLNPYGEDLRKTSRKLKREYKKKRNEIPKWDPERGGLGLYQRAAYRAVEKLDSDGDKAPNGWEIKHDKLPGQNWSVPAKLPKKPEPPPEEEGGEESEGEEEEGGEGEDAE
ncbi:MAG: hypothetical protein ACE5R4_04330 [Armatimonadota bacterium]